MPDLGEVACRASNDPPARLQSPPDQVPSEGRSVPAHSGAAKGWTLRRQAEDHQREARARGWGGLQLPGHLSFSGPLSPFSGGPGFNEHAG